jgi:hypothetical protein
MIQLVIRIRKTKRNSRMFLLISLAVEAWLLVITRLIAPIDRESP